MASTGVKYPSTAATAAIAPWDDNDWSNINNALTDDTTYATITADTFDIGKYSYVAKLSGFNCGVPAGATINGILVEIGAGADYQEFSEFSLVQLSKDNSTAVGTNLSDGADLQDAIVNFSYGGSSNLWGTTWTAAEVNSSNFAVWVAFTPINDNSDIYLDYVRVTITYTPASSARLSSINLVIRK